MTGPPPVDVSGVKFCASSLAALRETIGRRVVGMGTEIDFLLCAVLAERHVLVEGVPGLGKTHLVRTLASALGCAFARIQFTPDLLPADILGGYVYNPKDGEFVMRRGPIFSQVILADEINRAPAKTQSALLEVMQERQVTVEGQTLLVDRPFFVFATQNPLEHEGVYPLPQAQLDRFAVRLLVDYPSAPDERAILAAHRQALPGPEVAVAAETVVAMQSMLETVTISDEILALIVDLCWSTRVQDGVDLGASPRAGLDMQQLGRARALMQGRTHVLPDDLKAVFGPVVNHRIGLSPQAEISGRTVSQVIDEALRATSLV